MTPSNRPCPENAIHGGDRVRILSWNVNGLRACAKIAILRKCFDLEEMRADEGSIEIDFGSDVADRRYEF